MAKESIKPSDFMRSRRPELYSDTVFTDEPVLSKNQFEFHLETLTQRKEETRFEYFCRKLAEKELCPNLLPQTGPTGGGDSKTDSETYPVAESIAELWYVGEPYKASQERWAFAFSAKKDWRAKVRSDVESIAETKRDYSLIYFISNQSISDRKRSEVEDALAKQWGIPIRILDRTWIIDKVFENRRLDLVFQTLDIEPGYVEHKHSPGPQDSLRLQELEEIEKELADIDGYKGTEYQLVEDCLGAALLARGLGKPRVEIDGRFDRAERMARKHDNPRQLFRVLYNRAWTAYWWFDDEAELSRLYELAEPLVLDGEWIWDLERLVNLWQVIYTSKTRTKQDTSDEWVAHTQKLRAALLRHSADYTRPASALWARTQLVLMDLAEALRSGKNLPSIIKHINAILDEADNYLEFPADPLVRILQELGEVIDSKEFDDLFERVVQFQSKRTGNAEQGRLRLERGFQKLQSQKIYEAIEQFTKAQNLLAQEEVKGEFIRALAGAALGYEAAGLLWAARASFVFALDRMMFDFVKEGEIAPQLLPFLKKLIWIELQLGRVLCAVIWVEWFNLVLNALGLTEDEKEEHRREFGMMDAVLGILVMKTRFSDWPVLDRVPSLFEYHGLEASRGVALFELGYEDVFRMESELHEEDLNKFFSTWLEQPAANDLPENAEWHIGKNISMRTVVVGCEIEFLCENRKSSILFAEAILAFLESLFSTVILLKREWAFRSYLHFEIRQSEFAKPPFSLRVVEDECGDTSIVIALAAINPEQLTRDAGFQDALKKLLIESMKQMQLMLSKESLEELFENQRALDRAYLAASSILAVTNVLTSNPKYQMADWQDENLTECFALLRNKAWMPLPLELPIEEQKTDSPRFADGEPPEGMFGVDALKHRDFRVYSPINMPLWDKAKWRGIGVAVSLGGSMVPELALIFDDVDAGTKIFRGWNKRIGRVDNNEWIEITIITGTDQESPAHYRVAISSNHELITKQKGHEGQAAFIIRMQDMTPPDSTNLDNFISGFNRAGCYRLSLMEMSHDRSVVPYSGSELSILKRKIRIVPAWKISPHDPASGAIGGIENPLIPSDVIDPPIYKAMERRKMMEGRA